MYHIRQFDIERLSFLTPKIDIFMSHDWPTCVAKLGDYKQLMRYKPHFRDEIHRDDLGNPHLNSLVKKLQPKHWFAAHLHTCFPATIRHKSKDRTEFLALDKILPGRKFMQLIEWPSLSDADLTFKYDEEWLAITKLIHPFFPKEKRATTLSMQVKTALKRKEKVDLIRKSLKSPINVIPFQAGNGGINAQTKKLLELLELTSC